MSLILKQPWTVEQRLKLQALCEYHLHMAFLQTPKNENPKISWDSWQRISWHIHHHTPDQCQREAAGSGFLKRKSVYTILNWTKEERDRMEDMNMPFNPNIGCIDEVAEKLKKGVTKEGRGCRWTTQERNQLERLISDTFGVSPSSDLSLRTQVWKTYGIMSQWRAWQDNFKERSPVAIREQALAFLFPENPKRR